jgi:hypothetical protein
MRMGEYLETLQPQKLAIFHHSIEMGYLAHLVWLIFALSFRRPAKGPE